jgi:formyltetrahydrofolate synthetase
MAQESDKFIVDLVKRVNGCNKKLSKYDSELEVFKNAISPVQQNPKLSEIIESRNIKLSKSVLDAVEEFVVDARALSKILSESLESKEKEVCQKIYSDNKLAEAERSRAWLLFWQKSLRWSLGVVFALIMYSGAVFLSENINFIKIPVRDLITSHK